jgi:hypothetical protein
MDAIRGTDADLQAAMDELNELAPLVAGAGDGEEWSAAALARHGGRRPGADAAPSTVPATAAPSASLALALAAAGLVTLLLVPTPAMAQPAAMPWLVPTAPCWRRTRRGNSASPENPGNRGNPVPSAKHARRASARRWPSRLTAWSLLRRRPQSMARVMPVRRVKGARVGGVAGAAAAASAATTAMQACRITQALPRMLRQTAHPSRDPCRCQPQRQYQRQPQCLPQPR